MIRGIPLGEDEIMGKVIMGSMKSKKIRALAKVGFLFEML